jgi:hypothetical protein
MKWTSQLCVCCFTLPIHQQKRIRLIPKLTARHAASIELGFSKENVYYRGMHPVALTIKLQIKLSFATIDKVYLFLYSSKSRHVSAHINGHLQVIHVLPNIKVEVTFTFHSATKNFSFRLTRGHPTLQNLI